MGSEEKSEEPKEAPVEAEINPIDVSKATEYLEGIYGNLSLQMFRLEDVRMNGDANRYLVMCSLLTNVGGPRRYYFIKVDISNGNILKVAKGFRNPDTGDIDWKVENLPPEEE